MREPSLAAKLGAEFMGTFWLVFGGCGSAVLAAEFLSDNQVQLGIGFAGVGLAFGLIVLSGVYAFGHISGGHFNPAVTVGLALASRLEWRGVLPYVLPQVVAATVARSFAVLHCRQQGGERAQRTSERLGSPPTVM